ETSIKKDESETLTATITPANATNKGVTWESENPEIAIVNNGEVTAKKVGSTKIIVTTADGGKKAECLVTVIENVISVTGVSLNKTAANIQNGSTETLVATIMPTNATNKGVTWKSENTEIAVVNNGEVTAKKVGDTKIVVTTIDGEKKAECHITVTRKPGGGGGGGTIAGPKVSMPTSNLTSGEVVAGTAVELACTTGESKIYYTLDGSKPTKKSELYKEPIVIDKDTVVKAIGTRVGMSDSDILTVQYTIKKDDKPTDMRFTDLGGYEWAEKQINSLADKGIIKGVSETLFAPQDNITRADYTILLVRMLGVNADFTDNFDDIPEDAYYYKEIGVAKKLGIALGVGENKFDPKATVTREDLFVLAYRTLLDQKITLTSATKDEISAFTDAGDVSDYAKLAIATLVKNGLVEGFENKIKPKDFATRAETAVFIFRLDELIANK
ncbi:MAG: Ig-like domain-containing protein, partial [Oscillospiraceae bacterium]